SSGLDRGYGGHPAGCALDIEAPSQGAGAPAAGDLQYGAGRCGDRLVFHPGGCRLLARVRLQLPDRGDRRGRRLLHSGLPAAAGPAQSPRTEGPDSLFPHLMPLCAKKKSRVRWTRDFFSLSGELVLSGAAQGAHPVGGQVLPLGAGGDA
ncbi:Acyl-coenzyme A thioesterase PaaI, partial [Dysosmobacter welbionis]